MTKQRARPMDDVKKILTDAWQVVDGSGVPEILHPVAFEQAVLLLTGTGKTSPVQPTEQGEPKRHEAMKPATDGNGSVNGTLDEDAFFRKFADGSGVDEETLRGLYFPKDGKVHLSVPRKSLGASIADRNRTVALAVLAIKHYVEATPTVTVREVREAAELLGHDPGRNLARDLEDIPGTTLVGARSDKSVRAQGAKFDTAFAELAQRLTEK